MFFHIMRFLFYIPLRILFPTKVIGKKNLPKGKAVLTGNHKSNMDGVMVSLVVYRKVSHFAKRSWFKNPIVGCLIKSFGGIPVDRGKTDISTIKAGLRTLKNGKRLCIFPEGTRVKSEGMDMSEVKAGAAMLAIKAQAPIVPFWYEKKQKLFRFNKMYWGEPYELSQFYDKRLTSEVLAEAAEIVSQKILELKK